MAEPPTGTVTFLFTDIEGSTKLWERHPEAMRLALARHDALLRTAIQTNGGHVFKTIGDAFCAAFATPHHGVAAALSSQRALHDEPWGEVGKLRVRMALHTGAVEHRDNDYFGPPLNRVARLLAAGHGGQILVSQATAAGVRDALPDTASLRDLGAHRLKDLQQPEQLLQLLDASLPAEFPPLRSLEAFTHNLPRQLTSFVGREQEMAEVKRLLATTRLLTLTGSGGCGKTRLALQVAVELVEEFADGVWLVELAALSDGALVPQTVAAALGVREEPGRPLATTLTEYLRSRSLLLTLDNCEHLLLDCAQLADVLLRSCSKVRILASSREGLGIGGEQTYRVPSLSLPDISGTEEASWLVAHDRRIGTSPSTILQFEAVQLFADRARLSQAGFTVTAANAPAVVQLCRRLDGIPLAIELAAARVKALSVEKINERLDDRFRLLTGGSRTALPRQQTLRALIDWSYDLLAEPERALLRHLSVFAGGWTLEAAEAVCSGVQVFGSSGLQADERPPSTNHRPPPRTPEHLNTRTPEYLNTDEVLDLLTSLVAKSLVLYDERASDDRYRLLETVREYAGDRLREAGETATVRGRHRDWFLALAEEAQEELQGESQTAWLDRLEREHDNLRAALVWSEAHGPADTGLRLGGALGRFWMTRGYLREGHERLTALLALAEGQSPTAVRAAALNGAGGLARLRGEYAAARELLEEGLAIWRTLEDRGGIAESLNSLGILALYEGDYAAARAFLEQSMAIRREFGEKGRIVSSLNNLGYLALKQGEYDAARSLHEECLALLRELGDPYKIAMSLNNLAEVARGQGDYPEARAKHAQSLAMRQEMGDKWGTAETLEGLAAVAVLEAHCERAARLFGTAAELRAVIGVPVPPADRADYDRYTAAARAALGPEAFAAAWAEGRAMALTDAITYALQACSPSQQRRGRG